MAAATGLFTIRGGGKAWVLQQEGIVRVHDWSRPDKADPV